MLKRDVTYTDFNGDECTDTLYFNFSKPELLELEVEYEEGLGEMITRITKAQDSKEIIAIFKRVVLDAYGVKSADGKRFIKTPEDRVAFSQTGAYNELFVELASNADAAVAFLKGILPADLQAEAAKMEAQLPFQQMEREQAAKAAQRAATPPPIPKLPFQQMERAATPPPIPNA